MEIYQIIEMRNGFYFKNYPPTKDLNATLKLYRELTEIRLSVEVTDPSWFDHCQDWYENIHDFKIDVKSIQSDFKGQIHRIKDELKNNLKYLVHLNLMLTSGNQENNNFLIFQIHKI